MIVRVLNLLNDSAFDFHGSPDTVERQLRDRFEPFLRSVPAGDLQRCLFEINRSSVFHAEVKA